MLRITGLFSNYFSLRSDSNRPGFYRIMGRARSGVAASSPSEM